MELNVMKDGRVEYYVKYRGRGVVRWVGNANFGLKIAICKQNIRFCKMDYIDMNQ